jgi:hypothetical protein
MKKGNELYELLLRLGGMDRIPLEKEINRLLDRMGLDSSKLTMQDLRRVALAYLEELDTCVATKSAAEHCITPPTFTEELAEA